MICVNCKKQIPDESASCPYCGGEVNYERQVLHEIKYRRWQRWIFYFLLILVFGGMIGVIVKIYTANTKALTDIANVRGELEKKEGELTTAKDDLSARSMQLQELEGNLQSIKTDLEKRAQDLTKTLSDLDREKAKSDQYKSLLSSFNVYELIVSLGVGAKNGDLAKIQVADANLGGNDADSDGLSDIVENALGTDINKSDTDGDGYDDKSETIGGYNPLGDNKTIDQAFANKQKGKILLQVEGNGEAWYVGMSDGKRYFLGSPNDIFSQIKGATDEMNATSTPIEEQMPF